MKTLQRDLTTSGYWDQEWTGGDQKPFAASTRQANRRRKGRPLMRLLTEQLDKCELPELDLLELGCAPGGILHQLHTHRPRHRLHGLDYAPQGLEKAQRLFAAAGVPVSLHQGDLREFDPLRKYDVVYSCGLVEHFADPVPIIAHHARLCTPDGRVVVTVPNYAGRLQSWIMRRLAPEMLETHNLETMCGNKLRVALAQAGLVDIETGEFGLGKLYTGCTVRTAPNRVLRFVAKSYNAARRLLPLPAGWHSTIWAAGRVPSLAEQRAA